MPRALVVDRRFPLVGRAERRARGPGRAGTRSRPAPPPPCSSPGSPAWASRGSSPRSPTGPTPTARSCSPAPATATSPCPTSRSPMAFGDVRRVDDELAAAVDDGAGPLGPLFPARRRGRLDDAGPSARFELFEAVVDAGRPARRRPAASCWCSRTCSGPRRRRCSCCATSCGRPTGVAAARARQLPRRGGRPAPPAAATCSPTPARPRRSRGSSSAPLARARRRRARRRPACPPRRPTSVGAFARRVCDESARQPVLRVRAARTTCRRPASSSGSSSDGSGDRLPDPRLGARRRRPAARPAAARRRRRCCRRPRSSGSPSTSSCSAALVDAAGRATCSRRSRSVERVALVHEVDAGRFAFAHAIVRSTLLDGMSATRRALAHRRVAEAIEALRRGRPRRAGPPLAARRRRGQGQRATSSWPPAATSRRWPTSRRPSATRRSLDYHQPRPRRRPGADRPRLARPRPGPAGAGPGRLPRRRRGGRPARPPASATPTSWPTPPSPASGRARSS